MNEVPQPGFIESVMKTIQENYCNFNGRARRSEYWWFCLANVIVSFVLSIVGGLLAAMTDIKVLPIILSIIYSLAVLLPGIGLVVRRLHDIGKSGWYYFIGLIPCVGAILLIIWFCQDSQQGPNEYGDSPKYPSMM